MVKSKGVFGKHGLNQCHNDITVVNCIALLAKSSAQIVNLFEVILFLFRELWRSVVLQ